MGNRVVYKVCRIERQYHTAEYSRIALLTKKSVEEPGAEVAMDGTIVHENKQNGHLQHTIKFA